MGEVTSLADICRVNVFKRDNWCDLKPINITLSKLIAIEDSSSFMVKVILEWKEKKQLTASHLY